VIIVTVSFPEGSGTAKIQATSSTLSNGVILNKGWVSNTTSEYFNFKQDLILPQNTVYSLYVVTGGVNVAGTIVFHYHNAG